MSAVAKLDRTISAPLSWEAICAQYPDQWVCVVEMGRSTSYAPFATARVVGYGATRREPLEQARVWRDRYATIGHYFTGEIDAPVPRLLT